MIKLNFKRRAWTAASYIAFAIAGWFLANILVMGVYQPTEGLGHSPKVWQVLWDLRGLVLLPAPFILLGIWSRRKAEAIIPV
ncbi:hypothetical protein F3N42_14915 [Marinihelvus fidelis]|uniref:Uncharacterized protein n=1 Tax=Marinihelvus fidelis TaxID=2613842 RepID=A0A5N0T417_9GAMM|nr:hypothetical protein [Marinihelvus fidelis]KAA9129653.1 hypothetical protein F3N42_14915 [Marinihelvus fidelis]